MDEFFEIGADLPDPFRLWVRESCASTNDEARLLGEQGMAEGMVVLAKRQTAGRGRRGAAWFSPEGESLAFTILLRPQSPKHLWPRLSLATGLAVTEAIEGFTPLAGIKWPNDVWIRGKKVAGILVEAGRDFVLVGIGLNVNSEIFPDEVAEIATSLRIESGRILPRQEVLAAVIRHFAVRRNQIGADFHDMLEDVRLRCVLSGKQVSLQTAGGMRHGMVEGISEGGELLLRTSQGIEKIIQAEEVRIIA